MVVKIDGKIGVLLPIFVVIFLQGCVSLPGTIEGDAFIEQGVMKGDVSSFSIITTESEHNHDLFSGLDKRIYVTHLDGIYFQDSNWLMLSEIEKLYLRPGSHEIKVSYQHKGMYANGCLELVTEEGVNYHINRSFHSYSVSFGLENKETGERVGNVCGFKN